MNSNHKTIIHKLTIISSFIIIVFLIHPIQLEHFGKKFEIDYINNPTSWLAGIFLLMECYLIMYLILTILRGNNTTVDENINHRELKYTKVLGRSLDKWLKIFKDNDSRALFIKLSNEGDKESLKYQILLQQVTTTFLDILDDRYLRSDDYYLNYVKKIESARIEITEYLEETHNIKVKIRIYNEAIKKDKRSEDSAAGDDELTNQIINDMNIIKSNETIEENYKTFGKYSKYYKT